MDSQISKKDKLIIYSRTVAKIFRGGARGFSSSKPKDCSLYVRASKSPTGNTSPAGRT